MSEHIKTSQLAVEERIRRRLRLPVLGQKAPSLFKRTTSARRLSDDWVELFGVRPIQTMRPVFISTRSAPLTNSVPLLPVATKGASSGGLHRVAFLGFLATSGLLSWTRRRGRAWFRIPGASAWCAYTMVHWRTSHDVSRVRDSCCRGGSHAQLANREGHGESQLIPQV